MIRLVQLRHPKKGRRVAKVVGDKLSVATKAKSVYELATQAIKAGRTLARQIALAGGKETLDYNSIYCGESEWRLLPPFDHPDEPARCLVTGTGLTHKKSADNRQAMHSGTAQVTDSMKMYQWGLEGGRPAPGKIGVAPEWFYKGSGAILRAHGEPLDVPSFALDGGDEAEVAGIYLIAPSGKPFRVGLALGNEFSDHLLEEKNYLYLAHSKLRTCALGPELIVGGHFQDAHGMVQIERGDKLIWSASFKTGEKNLSHTLANLEHHHFKYAAHRQPGDAHIHFFGADAFSFGDRVELKDGDVMDIVLEGFGRALRNPIRIDRSKQKLVKVKSL